MGFINFMFSDDVREFKKEDVVHTEEWDPVKSPRKSNMRATIT